MEDIFEQIETRRRRSMGVAVLGIVCFWMGVAVERAVSKMPKRDPGEPFLEAVAPTAPVGRIQVKTEPPSCPYQLDGPGPCGESVRIPARNIANIKGWQKIGKAGCICAEGEAECAEAPVPEFCK